MSLNHLSLLWDGVRTSLWFVPGLCVALAIVIGIGVPEIEQWRDDGGHTGPGWVFSGSADGARSILSTVAGSLVTIVGVLFSITIVVLQQAASQFTPRVMGNFIRQKGTQLTLGVFLATFIYSLLVLRTVRGEDSPGEEFIPGFSITFSIVLAAVCLGFLVYFIHHMATSLQASAVLANVNREFRDDVGPLYPEHLGQTANDIDRPLEEFRRDYMPVPVSRINAPKSGYVQSVDDDSIVSHAPETRGIAILPQIGDFIVQGTPIIEVGEVRMLDEKQATNMAAGVQVGTERSRTQDPLFSIRQLVDIALKALSPSINDPTTANNAISMLGDSIALISTREFPDRIRLVQRRKGDDRGDVHVWTNRPPFAVYVDAAFSELRREAMGKVAVAAHLVETIGAIGDVGTLSERAEPLHQILTDILRELDSAGFDEKDEQYLRGRIDAARRRLLSKTPSDVG